jgi:hypothetical protein
MLPQVYTSCDEVDEDVISKDEFLNSTETGTDDKIDAERAIHAAAQAALLGQAQALSKVSPVIPVHYLPPLPALLSPPKDYLFCTRHYGGRGEAGRKDFEEARQKERAELEDSPEAAEPTASKVIAEGDNLIERVIGAKAAEQMQAENEDLHDERVCRLISSGYQPREAFEALAATKISGLESTARATEYLRVKSSTPSANMAKAVGACQLQIGLLSTAAASATAPSAAKPEAVFGPSLSDYVSNNERAEGVAGRIQLLHDKSSFGHLSNVSKAAINLKETVRRGADHELRNTMWLGAICLAVCEDCTKCAANRLKKEARQEADLHSVFDLLF